MYMGSVKLVDDDWKNKRTILASAKYEEWLGTRARSMGSTLSLAKPTFRNAICLALYEANGEPRSYQDLARILCEKKVLKMDKVQALKLVPSIRMIVSGLTRRLTSQNSDFVLEVERRGKEARVRFVPNGTKLEQDTDPSHLVRTKQLAITSPEEIARGLIRDGGGLPFASFYSSYRAAAQWLCYSSEISKTKKDYEASAFDAYQLGPILMNDSTSGVLGVVSLGPGEGLGEVALINRLLQEPHSKKIKKVQYLAVDSSEFLLMSHSRLIYSRFASQLRSGALVYVPIVGDLYSLSDHLNEARAFAGKSFISDVPVVCTFFGNCLGNYEYHEWDYFRAILLAFPKNQPLATLVGVSLTRRNGEKMDGPVIPEGYFMDAHALETPRVLLYDYELLVSEDANGKEIPIQANEEFLMSPEYENTPIPAEAYSTPMAITGQVYRFLYKLKNNIRTWDGEQKMSVGGRLLLHSIIKYNIESLTACISERGFEVFAPPHRYHVLQQYCDGKHYRSAVFAAIRRS
jgi:hypothetical protein